MSRPRAATSGGHEQVDLGTLECRQRLQAFVLGLVAMQRGRPQAVALEGTRQAGSTQLGVDEDDRLRKCAILQQLANGAPLVVLGHAVEALLHVGCRRIGPRHLDRDRVLQVAGGQAPDLGREGGREQQRLALPGKVGQDSLQVGQEADVQHAVGLVEHDVFDLVEHRVLRLDVVQQAAGA
jgi:hypothetical protein